MIHTRGAGLRYGMKTYEGDGWNFARTGTSLRPQSGQQLSIEPILISEGTS
jgi:hypothetical protein